MEQFKKPNREHAWRGAWDRPMHMDEDLMHPFTVARMTNHNVRGCDHVQKKGKDEGLESWENEGGSLKKAV